MSYLKHFSNLKQCNASRRRRIGRNRRGNVLVLAAFFMIVMMCFLAFAVDVGYMMKARTELQRSADSAAMAAAWQLVDERALKDEWQLAHVVCDARSAAVRFAGENSVCNQSPQVDANIGNDIAGDVVIGHLPDPTMPSEMLPFFDAGLLNAAYVRVRRTNDQNGEAPLFFARVLGFDSTALQADALAAFHTRIRGFRTPYDGSNVGFVPIALDEGTWNDMVSNWENGILTADEWYWDEEMKRASYGHGDDIPEINLYPEDVGEAGNRGTVDVGGDDNSTTVISRQIVNGLTPQDLEPHGGELKLDDNGELQLNGDTGISAGLKDDLLQIVGQPRTIPIFRRVELPGNNAMYTIVKFGGIRVMSVKLTGEYKSRRVIIQPAPVVGKGIIPSTSQSTSDFVFSPVFLVN
jgi:hypothetical protein